MSGNVSCEDIQNILLKVKFRAQNTESQMHDAVYDLRKIAQ